MEKLVLLDGGTGEEIIRRGYPAKSHPFWSTGAIVDNPELTEQVHTSFAEAGAQILFSNTYSLHLQNDLSAKNEDVLEKILRKSIIILDKVIAKVPSVRYVISVGPIAVKFHDCSEYNGAYMTDGRATITHVAEHYRSIFKLIDKIGKRQIALETIPTKQEVEVAKNVLSEFPGFEAFLTITAKNENQACSGDKITDIVKVIRDSSQIHAFGVNCSSPDLCVPIAESIHSLLGSHQSLIFKPNDGVSYNPNRSESEQYDLTKHFDFLVQHKVRYIGGCCSIGPSVIKRYANYLGRE